MASRHRCSFHCGRVLPADRPPPGRTRKSNLVDHMQPGDSQQVHTFEEPARNTPCSTRSFSSRQRVQSRMKPVEQPSMSRRALHPLRRTAPVTGRYTRYVALHPLRRAAPDQKRCNAHRSGAAPLSTSTFADAHYLPDPASAHLPPSPWTATHCGPNCHSLAVAIHGTFTGKLQT